MSENDKAMLAMLLWGLTAGFTFGLAIGIRIPKQPVTNKITVCQFDQQGGLTNGEWVLTTNVAVDYLGGIWIKQKP